MTILVLKGIYTYWRQTLPRDTVSHLVHTWYEPHDKVNHSRMDKVGRSLLLSKIKHADVARPQTAGSNPFARKKTDLISGKVVKKDKGMDEIIANRKKFLLRGNGNITGFYDAPEGIVSSYQANYKACKSTKAIQRTGFQYQSSIMTITPDPALFNKQINRQNRLKEEINKTTMKFSGENSIAKQAMNRALYYQQGEDLANHVNTPGKSLKLMKENAGQQYRSRGAYGYSSFMNNSTKTPMPVRVQNLMAPETN